jgi:hypothetical protein
LDRVFTFTADGDPSPEAFPTVGEGAEESLVRAQYRP